ncbi:iron-siderophore ABC transporter substrate-binding protein [Qingshengfaniella alkalisoli]|uniref:Iron-siderophore ABC transporter substrate-binding protein n=1 Tax=Qingshengfaniella alkalisoli TaxID=2599296 RepID=A0A5B8I954_9RHOB|nr:iron-siderophore ABC transporter substrate-binding protein [Qingshengfaniella alkalisoli]QDY70725.1 iron-siderophore ABC transporter substrate-binding protein [Qingshengfaniella alkalisoli]
MLRLQSIAISLTIAALFASANMASADDATGRFPVVIEHAYGSSTIESEPERIATVAWANHEVPLALGVVPVGFAAANFGDDNGDGVLPWVSDKLDELGAEVPVLFDEGDGIDFESVAATAPDVILAAYSGLSRADYETLSMIAPVIAFPDAAWGTDWRDMIRLNSAGMGMSAEGEALIAQIEADIAGTVQAHPELSNKTAMFITHLDATDLSLVRFYTENDTRVKFFHDLGLASPRSVVEASVSGKYSGEISAELIDVFSDVDIFVTYGGESLLTPLQADPLTSHMPAIVNGAVVLLGSNPVGTAANPTPLSIPWVLDEYVGLLAEAARKVE